MKKHQLNIVLWIFQALLFIMFVMAGAMKLFFPIDQLAMNIPWVKDVHFIMVRGLGLIDLIGALGLILPGILRIKPSLTLLAIKGLLLTMISAIVFHVVRGEANVIGFNIMLIAILSFVLWGRTKKSPILAK